MTALVFDCDGVLAESEREGHLEAFNRAFEEFGVPVRWSEQEYGEKLLVSGGKERVSTIFTPGLVCAAGLPGDPGGQREWLARFHARKTAIFREIALNGVILDTVLGRRRAGRFAVFAGNVAAARKPDPAIYQLALERLGTTPAETVVIEDSRNGLLAAAGGGLRCVITVSHFSAGEDFTGAALVVSSLGDPDEPMTVLANRSPASPSRYVTLADLSAVLDAQAGP